MKQSLFVFDLFDKDIVDKIYKHVLSLDDGRWVKRNFLVPARKVDSDECNYEFCGHNQMPVEVKDFLKNIAPVYENCKLSEIGINRYKVGSYIGKHKDRHLYKKNLVVSLQDSNNGILINDTGEFIKDKKGQCVLINGIGPIHSVPPVQELRYVLIYLYE